MSTDEDRELRGFVRGVVQAEADEVASADEVPDAAADQKLAAAMVAKYGAPRRPSPKLWLRVGGLGAAAALGVAVVVNSLYVPAPPDCTMTVRPNDLLMGPSSGNSHELSRDGILSIELRPRHATPDKLYVQAFVHSSGHYQDLPIAADCFAAGVCRVSRPAQELPLSANGPFELIVVLRHKSLPARAELVRALGQEPPRACADCQVLRQSLTLVGP